MFQPSLLPLCAALITAATLLHAAGEASPFTGHIVAGDQKSGQVLILKSDADWKDATSVLWHWHPALDSAIPQERHRAFANLSDMKVVDNGKQLLVAASGGGVALIDLATARAVFQAYPDGNPHAAALLPDGTIATASSHGNSLTLFTRRDGAPTPTASRSFELPDAHGVVWDDEHALLWALGGSKLNAYRYNFSVEQPDLALVQSFTPAKDFGGHDLIPASGEPHTLLLTGYQAILRFSTSLGRFTTVRKLTAVKSVSRHPLTGVILLQKPQEKWWSDTITTLEDSPRSWTLPGARFYKARWFDAR
ncbi:MAG: DUF6528 family protein [Oligosphaeraceae bacterium]